MEMVKVKVSSLKGLALDWAVAKSEGRTVWVGLGGAVWCKGRHEDGHEIEDFHTIFEATSDETIVSIIKREQMSVHFREVEQDWFAFFTHGDIERFAVASAESFNLAVARCFVISKLGAEIEIPKEFQA